MSSCNRVLKKNLPKNHFNQKCAPKFFFFIDKKIRKIQMIFAIENSFGMSYFGTF